MTQDEGKICVYFDGACPQCLRDRRTYEILAGKARDKVCWIDISDQEQKLVELGMDPTKELTELHVKDENERIFSELDAYILLMRHVPVLRPVAWLIGLPLIRPLLASIYHGLVNRRLLKSGRL
jgi:predicted DCC family thiol-disulfide oxidoreductase YuxK